MEGRHVCQRLEVNKRRAAVRGFVDVVDEVGFEGTGIPAL